MPTVDILRAPELRCRAVDSSNNSQPEGCVLARMRSLAPSAYLLAALQQFAYVQAWKGLMLCPVV